MNKIDKTNRKGDLAAPPNNAPVADNDSCSSDDDAEPENDAEDSDSYIDFDVETTCLFCTNVFKNTDLAISHLRDAHDIDLASLKTKFNMDLYSFIKLVNCISKDGITAEQLSCAKEAFWHDEKYLAPTASDAWLMFDFDELPGAAANSTSKDEIIREQSARLEEANEIINRLRESMQRMLQTSEPKAVTEQKQKRAVQCVANKSLDSDREYFASYAHFGIHQEMLSDIVRTTSYRDAMLNNRDFMRGKRVLDVGCGTSVLSYFAAQAGAKQVVGIDNSDIIYNAIDIITDNNVENVQLIKGRLENTQLPLKEFDIIISEWMGYFLIYECMLDTVIYARKTYLREGGMIVPNRCTLSIVGYGSEQLYNEQIGFWSNVYGLNMSKMGREAQHEPLVQVVDKRHVLTKPVTIVDLNMATVDVDYANFAQDFEFQCTQSGQLSAIVGYFDTFFDLPNCLMFSTSPESTPTHWKQVVFFIDKPQPVSVGDTVCGKIVCQRISDNIRSLNITIEIFGRKNTYYLN